MASGLPAGSRAAIDFTARVMALLRALITPPRYDRTLTNGRVGPGSLRPNARSDAAGCLKRRELAPSVRPRNGRPMNVQPKLP